MTVLAVSGLNSTVKALAPCVIRSIPRATPVILPPKYIKTYLFLHISYSFNIFYYINSMKASEVMKLLNIKSRNTLSNYVKEGLLKVSINPKGRYIYDEDSVYKFVGIRKNKKDKINISYARVSTSSQKNHLKEQSKRIYESCISKGIQLDLQLEDIKSGMSSDRKGFQELIQRVIKGEVELIIIENKDRLIRFNFDLLEDLFKYYGTKILVLNDTLDNKSYEQELTEDLISIIHYFSMKSYSHRRKLNKIRKELEEKENP